MYGLVALLAFMLITLNVYSTWILFKSTLATNQQKAIQAFLTWTLPLFGIIVLFIHNNKKTNINRSLLNDERENTLAFNNDSVGPVDSSMVDHSDTWSTGGGDSSGGGASDKW